MLRLNRMTVQRDIRSLIGTTPANTKTRFEPDRTANTTAPLRIPDHQRFYIWPYSKQSLLIESILSNSPLPLMVFTEQAVQGGSAWFVQDGQQRLITLQRFVLGLFALEDGRRFNDLDDDDRLNFLGYTVTCEIIQHPTHDQIANIFERLNCGKPLTDNDKFWNRRESAAVAFALNDLMRHPDLDSHFRKYVGNVGSGKSRSQLSDLVGAVVAVLKGSVDCIGTSFDRVGQYVCDPISESTKEHVIMVFKQYFDIIDSSLRVHSATRPRKLYIKLTGMLGVYLFWRLHPDYFVQEDHESFRTSIRCWSWFAWKLQDKDFKKDYFASLSAGHQRNVDREALKSRTDYMMTEFREPVIDLLTHIDDNTVTSSASVDSEDDDDTSNDSDHDDN